MTPAELARVPLFAGLDSAAVEHMFDLMIPFGAPAGNVLVREGERGDRMHIVCEGHLQVSRRLPGGDAYTVAELRDGVTIGELSLFVGGRRNATVTALGDTHGWTLGRHGFALLISDSRPASITIARRIGETVVARLRERCEAIAARLGGAPHARPTVALELPPSIGGGGDLDLGYLSTLLCFRRFEESEQVRQAVAARALRELSRGDELIQQHMTPAALYLVVRGAVEVRVANQTAAQPVRLAGPGRFVGHLGVLDDGSSPIAARARERTLLLEFPAADVRRLLDDPRAIARHCANAFYEDAARALRKADCPTARMEIATRTNNPEFTAVRH